MPHVFSQNIHPFGQCEHFNQVEPFEKPWFIIVMIPNEMVISHKINFTRDDNFMGIFQKGKWMRGLDWRGKHW
jgi:hypothetical protein